MVSLALTICVSWFGAFLPTSFYLLLISCNQRLDLVSHIRATSLCLCSLGSAIGCTFVYTSVPTAPLPPVLIFLVYIFQGSFLFQAYWIFECRTSFQGALQILADSSWKWKTHAFPCVLLLFGALAGLAIVILRYFVYYPCTSYRRRDVLIIYPDLSAAYRSALSPSVPVRWSSAAVALVEPPTVAWGWWCDLTGFILYWWRDN